MKTPTIEQLKENYDKLIEFINITFSDERQEKLLSLYRDFGDRIIDAPASGKEHFHYAIPGGYVLHILHVIEFSKKVHDLWEECGAYTENYTLEELLFAALNHDLGKIGDEDYSYYLPNESEWHRKNQGLIYEHNKKLEFMDVPQRSVYLLQSYGIKMTKTEMLGILLSDGLYDESNKVYLISYRPENQLRTNVPYIVHQADMMATHIEKNEWENETGVFKNGKSIEDTTVSTKVPFSKKLNSGKKMGEVFKKSGTTKDTKTLFKELFPDSGD